MYYSPLTSDYLCSIETQCLRANLANDILASQRASNNVKSLRQRKWNAHGFTSDSSGPIHMLMPEQIAINIYNMAMLRAEAYVGDLRIIWPGSANVGFGGHIYFNINQLLYQSD